jgi:EAL domain-containing protein (putative c-di-GMP-specific phosphodiesterase class I)/CheY-like chemotaxis protein
MDDVILAIDDEPALLDIIQKVARSSNFTAMVTTDPAAFRTALVEQPPSVVLLDLQMPDCDGIELLHALADAHCRAKVILMSGFDARVLGLARGIGQGLGLDMGDPLPKPLRIADLRQILAKVRSKSFDVDAAGLREAIDSDRLELFYQPLVTLSTGEIIGFEGLVRWQHPEFGIIPPDRFIPLAERENLINPLTDRVLELAAAQIAVWKQLGIGVFVSVNISAANIVADLPDQLARLCVRHGIPPRLLRLELTETAAMGNHTLMLEILTRIRLKGFQLAIDDFGTGYSSLVQLHRLPFSELKIDQSFVREMAVSEEANLIVGTIVNLGHSLHLDLIAEGIETEDLMDRLIEMGCETGQGYFFSRPMPAGDVPGWLAARPPHSVTPP